MIFRSLHDFESLWIEMKNLGNIDCDSQDSDSEMFFEAQAGSVFRVIAGILAGGEVMLFPKFQIDIT